MIKYTCGNKYQVVEDYSIQTNIFPPEDIKIGFVELTKGGLLALRKGFASDGPSGPTIDTESFMEGSFVHDGLYKLLRSEKLSSEWRDDADITLVRIAIMAKMLKIRSKWVFLGVRKGAGFAANPDNKKKVIVTRELDPSLWTDKDLAWCLKYA